MNMKRGRWWRAAGASALAGAVLLGIGCDGKKTSGSGAGDATAGGKPGPDRTPDQVYTVRGRVDSLPAAGKPLEDFFVHHERIDSFVDGDGERIGMPSHSMMFPRAPGVSLEGLAIGDVVEVTFSVWWEKGIAEWRATKIVKLPADTALDLTNPE